MPKLGKDKVGLYVSISKETEKALRELIMRKYGDYRKGYLSYEVECALQAWIATHKSTQTDSTINRINPIPKYYLVWQDVKRFIEQRHGVRFEEIHEIPAKFIREAIAFVRGTDKRTIKKWLKVFTEQKLIKWITPELVEVVG